MRKDKFMKVEAGDKTGWQKVSAYGEIIEWKKCKKGFAVVGTIRGHHWQETGAKEFKRTGNTHFPIVELVDKSSGRLYSIRTDVVSLQVLEDYAPETNVKLVFNGKKPIPGSNPMFLIDVFVDKAKTQSRFSETVPMPQKRHKGKSRRTKKS